METTTRLNSLSFLLSSYSYFFSYSQIIDYYLTPPKPSTLRQSKQLFQTSISQLEMVRSNNQYLNSALTLFKLLHSTCKVIIDENDGILSINPQTIKFAANSQTLQVIHNILDRLISSVIVDNEPTIQFQMSVKVILNLLYILLRQCTPIQYQQYHKDLQELLLKFIQKSLEHSFIPIKKVVILFYFHLTKKFQNYITPTEQLISKLQHNVITQDVLNKSLQSSPLLLSQNVNVVEQFFAKYNIKDCILAQQIVVGLLRALLNVCNQKPVANNNGVDIFKQWRVSFNYVISSGKQDKLPVKNLIKQYKQWEQNLSSSGNIEIKSKGEQIKSLIQEQIDRHRMFTAGAIGSFFTYLLISFKKNEFLQFTYLIQLISDANGVLVLLKFLTDKFSFGNINPPQLYSKSLNFNQSFKNVLVIILQLLYISCKNSVEKINGSLIAYNGYLIFKKISTLVNQDSLVDELVHLLLKMQLPYLAKKSKQSLQNMKLISEIYCKHPPDQIKWKSPLSNIQRLKLKNKIREKPSRELTLSDDIKSAHLQFNNHHYWHVQAEKEMQQGHSLKQDLLQKLLRQVKIDQGFDHKQWLQQNVWGYYD